MSALLKIGGLSKSFGGFAALTDVSLEVAQGERFGLIGPNGSGKTTLINCVSGLLRNDAGSIVFNGEEVSRLPAYRRTRRGIARSFQVPRPFHTMTVLENLLVPSAYVVHLKDAEGEARASSSLRSSTCESWFARARALSASPIFLRIAIACSPASDALRCTTYS